MLAYVDLLPRSLNLDIDQLANSEHFLREWKDNKDYEQQKPGPDNANKDLAVSPVGNT